QKLDAAAARKSLKHMRASDAKRAADAGEREVHEREWGAAAEKLNRHLAAGSAAAKTRCHSRTRRSYL
ncbi:MAG: hypothetical protein ABI591_09675, partial [Kofleriaceae bacterium]